MRKAIGKKKKKEKKSCKKLNWYVLNAEMWCDRLGSSKKVLGCPPNTLLIPSEDSVFA